MQNDIPTDEYVAPRNDTEHRIATIWKRVLNVEQVGVRDSFSDLGGDSLHAIRVINGIKDACAVVMTIEQFLAHCTIEAQAQAVDRLVSTQ
jgi:acyl carrier protein